MRIKLIDTKIRKAGLFSPVDTRLLIQDKTSDIEKYFLMNTDDFLFSGIIGLENSVDASSALEMNLASPGAY